MNCRAPIHALTALLLASHAPCLAGVVHATVPPFRGQPDTGYAAWETFTQGLDAANAPDDPATSLSSAALRQLWTNGYVDGMGNLASFDLLAVRVEDTTPGDLQEVVVQLALLGTQAIPSSFVLVDQAGGAYAPSAQVVLFDDGFRRERWVLFDVAASQTEITSFRVDFVTALAGGGALDALILDTRLLPPAVEAFCASDAAGAACPCTPGAAGRGCPSPANGNGAALSAVGAPGTAGFALYVEGLDPVQRPTVLLVRATSASSPFVHGDGLWCLSAPVGAAAGSAEAGALAMAPGHDGAPGTVFYQALYRSRPVGFCDPFAAFNSTNGLIVRWR